MIISRNINVLLTINDFNVFMSKDITSSLFELVKEKYIGICYQGTLIKEIVKIIYRSNIESNQYDLNGSFNVSITFEANCESYSYGEVMADMKIINITNNAITLRKDNVLALMKTKNFNINLKKDSLYPIIVAKASFEVGHSIIKINAIPFIAMQRDPIVYKTGELSDYEKEKLNYMLITIKNEEDRKIKLSTKLWDQYSKMIYPYKDDNSNQVKYDSLINLKDINKLENTFILDDDRLPIMNCKIALLNKSEIYLEDSTHDIIYKLLKNYYLFLKLVNDLCEFYSIEDTANIFELYDKYKK